MLKGLLQCMFGLVAEVRDGKILQDSLARSEIERLYDVQPFEQPIRQCLCIV
jgi:hypothetical protein